MKELIGGLWLGALLAGALFGLIPGLILFCLGVLCSIYEISKEIPETARTKNTYPPYGY